MSTTHTGLSPALAGLSRPFCFSRQGHWPAPLSLATTRGISVDVCSSGYCDVSVPRVCLACLWIQHTIPLRVGCPIRTSTDQRRLAAPRGFSQRATSFIASWCQGIHRMPFSYAIPRNPTQKGQALIMHRNHPQTRFAPLLDEPAVSLSRTQQDCFEPGFSATACAAPDPPDPINRSHNASEPSPPMTGAAILHRTHFPVRHAIERRAISPGCTTLIAVSC